MKINPEFDPMGRAIVDYFEQRCEKSPLVVSSSLFEDDVMPVANLFRTESQMPVLERRALSLCSGRVLDVGAGAGCHSLALQQRGLEVTAVDISELSVETMATPRCGGCPLCGFFYRRFVWQVPHGVVADEWFGYSREFGTLARFVASCQVAT